MNEMHTAEKAWRAVVRDSSEVFSANALTFDTEEQAREYARELSSRWLAVREFAAIPSDVTPDHGFHWSRSVVQLAAPHGIEQP